MKKLINAPADVVREAVEGLAAASPELLVWHDAPLYLRRRQPKEASCVALVSGGGSGHEPLHGGYVGFGMLDAACPGDVFTSPTPDQIEAATRAVATPAGALHLVKNYTGDVMNFDMARELCQADGMAVEAVVINDDVAVKDSLYTAGRRGMGTTVFAEKICGAAAEQGLDLPGLASLGREVNDNGRSMGMALSSCTVPAAGKPTFTIGEEEMEVGVGIHGEPGCSRTALKPVREIVELLCRRIFADLPFRTGDEALVLVSGMGATPLLELQVVFREVARACGEAGIRIARSLVGNYITSLDMAGVCLSFLRMSARFQELWDFPVHTPALRWGR